MSNKSKGLAALFAFFLGGFGVHRFYLDKPGTGIIMAILTLTFVGAIFSGIWALVDLIVILTGNFKDGKGLKVQ